MTAHTHDTPDLTPQQQKVLEALTGARKALSAYDILDQLQKTGIKSPPTIYRALEKLTALGLIHRIESLNAYVACCQYRLHDCGHVHGHSHNHVSQFAICTKCGAVQEIESDQLVKLVDDATSNFLSNVDKKVFELSGICHACVSQTLA